MSEDSDLRSRIDDLYNLVNTVCESYRDIDDRLVRLEKALGTFAQSIMEEEDYE